MLGETHEAMTTPDNCRNQPARHGPGSLWRGAGWQSGRYAGPSGSNDGTRSIPEDRSTTAPPETPAPPPGSAPEAASTATRAPAAEPSPTAAPEPAATPARTPTTTPVIDDSNRTGALTNPLGANVNVSVRGPNASTYYDQLTWTILEIERLLGVAYPSPSVELVLDVPVLSGK